MKLTKYLPSLLLVLVSLIGAIAPDRAWGQVNLGAIKGETEDTQHAAIPNVKLTLRNDATGVVQTSVSGAAGEFSILDLVRERLHPEG